MKKTFKKQSILEFLVLMSSILFILSGCGYETSFPTWSPDGQQIAYGRHSLTDGHRDLVIMDVNEKKRNIIIKRMPEEAPDPQPSWSPDGKKIAFAYLWNGISKIHIYNTESKKIQRLDSSEKAEYSPNWSSKNKIVFICEFRDYTEIFIMNSDGSERTQITFDQDNIYNPVWSPDCSKIAYSSDRSGTREIWTIVSDGSNKLKWTKVPEFLKDGIFQRIRDTTPKWLSDNSTIVFSSDVYKYLEPYNSAGLRKAYVYSKVFKVTKAGTNPIPIDLRKDRAYNPEISPDGTQIVYVSTTRLNIEKIN